MYTEILCGWPELPRDRTAGRKEREYDLTGDTTKLYTEEGFCQSGVYRLSRNPMYAAYFLLFLGCALLTRSLPLLLCLAVFQLTAHVLIRAEERWCLRTFGAAYARYMGRVRRYL